MGVHYSPIPLDEFLGSDEATAWLEDYGLRLPESPLPSRYPTASEIRMVIEALADYDVEYSRGDDTWVALVSDRRDPQNGLWASIYVFGDAAEENVPQSFYFERGDPELVARVTERLARYCGPFVLLTNGEEPQLVLPPPAD